MCTLLLLLLLFSSVKSQVNLWLKEKSQAADTKLSALQGRGTDISKSASHPEPGTFASGRLMAAVGFIVSNLS